MGHTSFENKHRKMSLKYDLFFQCYPSSHSIATKTCHSRRQSSDHRNNLPCREIGSSVLGARLNNLRHTKHAQIYGEWNEVNPFTS